MAWHAEMRERVIPGPPRLFGHQSVLYGVPDGDPVWLYGVRAFIHDNE